MAADPAVVPGAAAPAGWDGLVYYRLHGTPRVYHSPYSQDYLADLAGRLCRQAAAASVWCVFDNTAIRAAMLNALDRSESCAGREYGWRAVSVAGAAGITL
jgi:uncharacterized protein YecE (DUF72 family)